jgi:hypothetical protein
MALLIAVGPAYHNGTVWQRIGNQIDAHDDPYGVGRGYGIERGLGAGVGLGVGLGVSAEGSVQYLPPVFKRSTPLKPPQIFITLPLQTAVWEARASGALVVLVAVQLSASGLYLPPVSKRLLLSLPRQTIISLPVHTAV